MRYVISNLYTGLFEQFIFTPHVSSMRMLCFPSRRSKLQATVYKSVDSVQVCACIAHFAKCKGKVNRKFTNSKSSVSMDENLRRSSRNPEEANLDKVDVRLLLQKIRENSRETIVWHQLT